jgi:hypothetical protein
MMPDQPTTEHIAEVQRLERAEAERQRVRDDNERQSQERAEAIQRMRERAEDAEPKRISFSDLVFRDFPPVGNIPVSIYLADEDIHKQVEKAVKRWLAKADLSIDKLHKPVIGSWFRRMDASVKREALLTATHIADSRLVQTQDAYVTSTLLQNVGPVLLALQPTKDAVVRAGALLIVKIDWVVQIHQLTAVQQATLDHRPHLAASPKEIIAALQDPESVYQKSTLTASARRLAWGKASGLKAD